MIDICIPATRPVSLQNLLDSIVDQDINGIKVSVFADKNKDVIEEVVKKYSNLDITFNYKRENNQYRGASRARNSAACNLDDTTNKYIMFIDDDCEVKPGILQNMLDVIEKTQVDFVYGDYEFEDGNVFHSREFNPYVLRTHNYISTMSLMTRKMYVKTGGFKPDLPYFQDWDFFYRAVKLGFKGHYLKEIIFKTANPTKESISGIQLPLSEKAKTFAESNNIQESNLVVTTFSAQLQAEQRAEMLNADYAGLMNSEGGIFPINLQYPQWTHTYMVGCFNSPVSALVNHLNVMVGKKILHFIGTDVFQLMEKHNWTKLQLIKDRLEQECAILLSNSKILKKEMKDMGIDTKLVYTPLYKPERFVRTALPEDFTVAVYYSDTRNMNFFNVQGDPLDNNDGESNMYLLWEVVKAMPHVKFKFFGGKAKFKTENAEFVGRVPNEKMGEFINSCSAILTCTLHNSLPHLPLQFMLAGRQSIDNLQTPELNFTNKLSFTDILHFENCKDEIINKVQQVYKKQKMNKSVEKKVNKLVFDIMSVENYRKEIDTIMKGNK